MGTEILTVCDRFFAAAINGIYQGIIITALLALSLRLLRRTNAATRHAVWLCTLVLLVFLVVAHYFADSLPFARHTETATIETNPKQEIDLPTLFVVQASTRKEQAGIGSPAPYMPDHWAAEPGTSPDQSQDTFPLALTEPPPSEEPHPSAGNLVSMDATLSGATPDNPPAAGDQVAASDSDARSVSFYKLMRRLANPVATTLAFESPAARIAGIILLVSWLVLASVRIFVLILRLHQIRKLKQQSYPPDAALNEFFQRLVARLDMGRKVELKISPGSHSALVLGFLHPAILLPREPMEPKETEQVLHHELAHVRRRDDWVNLVQHLVLAAFPFHPAVWWVSRQMSLEREIACDDYVLQSSASSCLCAVAGQPGRSFATLSAAACPWSFQ